MLPIQPITDQWQVGYLQDAPLKPTRGPHVYYNYQQFVELDENGKKIAISINLFMINEIMVMEKVTGDTLIGRMTFMRPVEEMMKDDALTFMDRHRYHIIHTDYFIWNHRHSPEALEREERIKQVLEGDFVGKTLKFMFRKVPQFVSANASEVKNLFFLSLSHVKHCSFAWSFGYGKTTRNTSSNIRIVSEDNPSPDDDKKESVHTESDQVISNHKKRRSASLYSAQQVEFFRRNGLMRNNSLRLEIPKFSVKSKSPQPLPVTTMAPRIDRRLHFIYKIFSPS